MPRPVADRIGIGIYETAKANRACGRCLAAIVAGGIATRPAKLSDGAARLHCGADCMSKRRETQSFFPKVTLAQA